jgi:hypothetical protein
MIKIRTLQIHFDMPVEPWELDAFRGAVAGVVGHEHVLFHNHLQEGFRYRYPLIQYKLVDRRPMIYCIGEAVEEVHHFFREHKGMLLLNGRSYDIRVHRVKADMFTFQVWDQWFTYHISKWHALSQKNYQEYRQLTNDNERHLLLEKILKGNILAMAKGLEWQVDKHIDLRISQIEREDVLPYKNKKIISISARFTTNVSLPEYIGLGSHTSAGFGMVRKIVKP